MQIIITGIRRSAIYITLVNDWPNGPVRIVFAGPNSVLVV